MKPYQSARQFADVGTLPPPCLLSGAVAVDAYEVTLAAQTAAYTQARRHSTQFADKEFQAVLECIAKEDEPLGPVLISVKTDIEEARLIDSILPELARKGALRVSGSGRQARYSVV